MRRTAPFLSIILLVAVVAAGLAFVAGRVSADRPGAFTRGERAGRTAARARYAPGGAAYTTLTGAARRAGFTAGRDAGIRIGRRRGRAAGRSAAFEGFSGGWDVGRWYLVNIAPGDGSGQVAIGARVALRRSTWYGLCARQGGLCRKVSR